MSREAIRIDNKTPYDFHVLSFSGDHFYGPPGANGDRPGYIPSGTAAPSGAFTEIGQITDPSPNRFHTGNIQIKWDGLKDVNGFPGVSSGDQPYTNLWLRSYTNGPFKRWHSYKSEVTQYDSYVEKANGAHYALDGSGHNSFLLKASVPTENLDFGFECAASCNELSSVGAAWLQKAAPGRSWKAFMYLPNSNVMPMWIEYHRFEQYAVFFLTDVTPSGDVIIRDVGRNILVKLTSTASYWRNENGSENDWNKMDDGGFLADSNPTPFIPT